MAEKRRDSKGRILRTGESQRKDGRYAYKYTDSTGKPQFVYAWKLVATDKTPAGKRDDISLREKEKEINQDTVIHIGDDGKVTKEPAEKGGDAENGYFLTVTLNHLSQVFGAKSSEVSDIPVDPGELGAAAMPKVTYTKLADMTGAVTGVNGTINQNDVYNESGVLVVKNTSEATQRYIISVGPKATANSFNIAYVVKLEKNEQYVLQCQQTLAVKVVGVGMTTNLNEKFKMEDFDIDDWVNVTEAENSYTGVTAD